MLFATNHPMPTAGQALARFDDLGLDGETRSLFLAGNARRACRL